MPRFNITSGGGYHIREAGATRNQDLAFSLSIMAAYMQAGIDAGLDIDSFASHFTFNAFGGSMELYKEVAFQRAARRMYARMVKNRFGAKNPKSMKIRSMITAHIGCSSTTLQRPLNNLSRGVIGGAAGMMSGGLGVNVPYDEPLGLGHSLEAQQLSYDALRILLYEARLGEIRDPWAGSYFMESLTDEIEDAAQAEFDKIDEMGGAVAAIENGYMQRAVAGSAYERQKAIDEQEYLIVGVNCFNGPSEIEVMTEREVPDVYPAELIATAEERKKNDIAELKQERNSRNVFKNLNRLQAAAGIEEENLMSVIMDCVKSYATLQEICDVLRDVFGEAVPVTL
jgi:methylmalonyl-CoA mutase N-terminal domain/subunit